MTAPDLIALRREIHGRPELAGHERHTASLVAERLRAAGLDVSTGVGGHGVVAVLDGGRPGRTVAYRADMDAVPTASGAAHLCGHDVHTAVGVGVAEALAREPFSGFSGRVVFVFQPAEETLEGARAMIETGFLDSAKPDEIYAVHCGPLPVGTLAVMPGSGLPGVDLGHVDVADRDAAQRLCAAIEGLSTVRRPGTPEEFAQMAEHLATPDGPLSRFVFAGSWVEPGTTRVRFYLRAWPDERYPALREELRRLAGGARVEFSGPPFPAMVCSPELSYAAADHLRGVAGVEEVAVLHAAFPFNGEDFALFLHRIPGAMFYLGVGVDGVPHADDFVADEGAIGFGVHAMADLLLARLKDRDDRGEDGQLKQ